MWCLQSIEKSLTVRTMAKLVGAIATSHGPLLSTPAKKWFVREAFDRTNPALWYRGEKYTFDELAAARAPGFASECTISSMTTHFDRCQKALDELAAAFADMHADLVIILGNDQDEVFHADLTPAFTIYTGSSIANVPMSTAERLQLEPGLEYALIGHTPEEGATYRGAPDAARHLVDACIEREFDVAVADSIRPSADGPQGIPHAYGFVYRRITRDAPPPSIPIFSNVGIPPNRPSAKRVHRFGKTLGEAIESLPGDARVVAIASGGMSHYVIDEDLDTRILEALLARDEDGLLAVPESFFEGNTSELKSWIALAGLIAGTDVRGSLIDYVPCYRSVAGTGNAMGFVVWR